MNQIESIPVFRNGTIVYYDKKYSDISWSYEENLEAASFYATCVHQVMNEERSYSLAYMYIMNKRHPDMFFQKTDMDMIQSLVRVSGK